MANGEISAILQEKEGVTDMKRQGILVLLLTVCLLLVSCGQPAAEENNPEYIRAQELYAQGLYEEAAAAFEALGSYKDSRYILSDIRMAQKYEAAMALLEGKDYPGAFRALSELGDYKDVNQQLARFSVVEVTEENWQDYYEINLEYSTDNTTGELRAKFNCYFQIKEDVYPLIYDLSRNECNAQLAYTEYMKSIYVDQQTGEYYFMLLEDDNSRYKHYRTAHVTLTEDMQKAQFDDDYQVVYQEMTGEISSWANEFSDFEVTAIEGKLYLYQ